MNTNVKICFLLPLREHNETLLMDAVYYDRADIVHMLINNGCDVRARNDLGWSVYHYAALNNSRTSLGLLLKHDTSHVDDVEDGGSTPLHYAVLKSNIKSVELLLQHKANQTIRNKSFNKTALDLAELWNLDEIVELLKNKLNILL